MAAHSSKPRRPRARPTPLPLTAVLSLHQGKRFAEADAGYRRLIEQRPADCDAWHLWGVLAAEEKQFDAAVERIRRALELNPHQPEFLGNLGNVFLEQKEFGQAIDCLHELALLRPDDESLRKRLTFVCEQQLEAGIAHQKSGQLDDAETCYRAVLRGRPENADAWHLLGLIALARNEYEAASEGIERAIALNPTTAAFHNNLGGLRFLQKRYREAIASCEEALRLQPDLDGGSRNLSKALRAQRRYAEAESVCRTRLQLRPDDPDAYNDLGSTLQDAGRHKEAENAYRDALRLRPQYDEVLVALGILLRRLNRRKEALECFEQVSTDPRFSYAVGFAADCRARMCDWSPEYANVIREVTEGVREGKKYTTPFLLINFCDDAALQRSCAEVYAKKFPCSYSAGEFSREQRCRHDRIRLAYVSPDFREHPVTYLLADLIERHDRSRFEVIGVSIGGSSRSPWRKRLMRSFDRFEDVYEVSDEDVVRRLRDLEIDIAVDLAGYTAQSRPLIFASRAAPIQVNYLGFPGTMGAQFMDYIVADRVVIPENQQGGYVEKVACLPGTFQCASLRDIAERTPTRAELGLPETGFVFCCFNNTYKIQPEFFDVWMRLLIQIEGSVLWFRRANESVEDNLRREARARGCDPDRLIFAERLELPEHFARQRQADLFLDTLPYNAHTTASDALWAGLPVLTCTGSAFAGRVGASLLHAVGLPELVTENLADYEALALRLASRPEELIALKRKLQRNLRTEPLFDVERFCRHIEAAYQRMWATWLRGEEPAAFAVEPIAVETPADRRARLSRMPDAAWSRSLNGILDHSRAGRFEEAEAGYQWLLEARPEDPDAWHLWGVLAAQQKQFEAAAERIRRALQLKPHEPEFLGNLGNVHLEQGHVGRAIDCYREAAERRPEDPEIRKRLAAVCERRLDAGIAYQRGGRLAEAESCYLDVLRGQPQRADAWHLLGAIALERDQYVAAEVRINRAIELASGVANYHNSLGIVYQKQGRYDDAIPCYEKALRLDPLLLTAHQALGSIHITQGRSDEAVTVYRRAVQLHPRWAEGHLTLGDLLRKRNEPAEAERAYRDAIEADPNRPEAYYRLGNLFVQGGRPHEAEAAYRKSLERKPAWPQAQYRLGKLLLKEKRPDEAAAHFRKAIELRPDNAEFRMSLGRALDAADRAHDAEVAFRKALELDPNLTDAHYHLGNLLFLGNRLSEALASFRKVTALDVDCPFAAGMVAHCQTSMCDWSGLTGTKQCLIESVHEGKPSITPLPFLALCDDPIAQRRCAEIFVRDRFLTAAANPWSSPRYRHDKIRVAYVSPDYRSHPTAYLIADLIERHDRSRFQVIGVSLGPDRSDPWRERLKQGFDQFIDVSKESDRDAVHTIRDLEIDIAVDLAGYTTFSRTGILAARVAPIQVNYLGFPGTMGADFIDYIVADRFVIPPVEESNYVEKVVCLPDTYQCNSKREMDPPPPHRQAVGLPENGFVFCCFNNTHKIQPEQFAVWMRLLTQAAGSVLWLLKTKQEVEDNLRREAGALGVSPDRLIFAPRLPLGRHLARHRMADLFLDTLPYNAHTTASDALWSGLPVLTCAGRSFASRVAGSLLHAVGSPELVTQNLGDYEALALRLASRPEDLTVLKQKLQRNLCTEPLFDVERFCRHIEAAYQRMWATWQRGEEPAAFAVEQS